MTMSKKFIAPGAWFAMSYPASWSEFEDGEGSFLFYNPEEWSGNFRISAFKGDDRYADKVLNDELRSNDSARLVQVGAWKCAYSKEMFEEEGAWYTQHLWVMGQGDMAFEVTFTVPKGGLVDEAEKVIATLEPRIEGVKYPAEIIPVRLSEIALINESYEWVSTTVKDLLKKDFQGAEEDIPNMQELVDRGGIARKKKEAWLALGITLCVIMANEIDGLEWRTLIDGNREAPVLLRVETYEWIDPMKLVWSKVKAGEEVKLAQAYEESIQS